MIVKPYIIGIAGGTGSGKSTFASKVVSSVGSDEVALISHDSYYKDISHLTLEQRAKQNFDHPDALDTELLVDHLRQLKESKIVHIPTYDFGTHSRTAVTIEVIPKPVIIVEGILIFSNPALMELFDVKVFIDMDADIRLLRRLKRDIVERQRTADSVMEQYLRTVRPMHALFVEPCKCRADMIVPGDNNDAPADIISAKIRELNRV